MLNLKHKKKIIHVQNIKYTIRTTKKIITKLIGILTY